MERRQDETTDEFRLRELLTTFEGGPDEAEELLRARVEQAQNPWIKREPTPPPRLNAKDLIEIEARTVEATPGPWKWTHDEVNERYKRHSNEQFIYLLQGPDRHRPHGMGRDPYEKVVMQLRWFQVRGKEIMNAGPLPDDACFIEHSREDVDRLCWEVRRCWDRIARLEEELEKEKLRAEAEIAAAAMRAAESIAAIRVDPQRSFSTLQRQEIYRRSNGHCVGCGTPLDSDWHADHVFPHSRGGRTEVVNGQALCQPCNSRKRAKVLTVDES